MKAVVTVALALTMVLPLFSGESQTEVPSGRQCIIWSSADRDVALNLVFMYAFNAKKHGWMADVTLLIWGPSAKLLSVDKELQAELKKLEEIGVELLACKGCADRYGVSEDLEKLGVTVKYTGKLLADMQKEGWHVLTF
jgi:hypothetical protein